MTTAFRAYNLPLFKTAIANPIFSLKAYYCKNLTLAREFSRLKAELLTEYSKRDLERSAAGAGLSYKEAIIYLLVRRYKPRLMIETGVANGATSYCILRAMRDNGVGSLISVDYPMYKAAKGDPFHLPVGKRPGWLVPDELRGRWRLLLGKSGDILPKLGGRVDMFFHDSEHSYKNMMFEYNWAIRHMKRGGILLSDDVGWNRAFGDFVSANRGNVEKLRIPVYGGLRITKA